MARVGAELRRRDFVEATVRVIAEHGAAGATTRRIAVEAGCPLATLHYVFRTKEDLFAAVYESLLEEAQTLTLGQDRTLALREAAPAHLRELMRWMVGNRPFARAQAELFTWALRFNPQMAQSTYLLTLDLARSSLHESGGDPAMIDALARLVLALIDGMLASWFASEDAGQLMADTEVACRTLTALIDSWPAPAAVVPVKQPRRRAATA